MESTALNWSNFKPVKLGPPLMKSQWLPESDQIGIRTSKKHPKVFDFLSLLLAETEDGLGEGEKCFRGNLAIRLITKQR